MTVVHGTGRVNGKDSGSWHQETEVHVIQRSPIFKQNIILFVTNNYMHPV
jgi:hypothetical protein